MKIEKKQGTTFVELDDNGKISVHLPYYSPTKPAPRHIEEFLILIALWAKRDKQLLARIGTILKEKS